MAQEAYNFARFETVSESAPQKKQQASLRSVKGGRQNNSALQKVFGNAVQLAMVAIFFAAAIALVQSEVKLTEYTRQIQIQSAELTTQQSRYSYLENALNASVNLDQVEKVAKQIGLVKMDESQVTYIRLEDEAMLNRTASTFEQWVATVRGAWVKIVEGLAS